MRRVAIIAIVLALLAVTAQPAAAANASGSLEVASKHTNATDFNNATELTNVTVEGSGTDASVALTTQTTVDSFEDGDISEYTGDTADFTVNNNAPVFDGTQSLKGTSTGGFARIFSTSGLSNYPAQGDTIVLNVQSDSGTSSNGAFLFGVQDSSNFYQVLFSETSNELTLTKVDGGSFTTLKTVSATYPQDEKLTATVDWQSGGSIDITITDSGGSTVATLSASDNTFSSGGIGFGGLSGWTYDHYRIGGSSVGAYISSTHSASEIQEGWTNLTLQNAEAEVTWLTDTDDDGTFETTVNSTTFTTSGNKTLALDTQYDDWRVNVTFTAQSGTTTAKLHDEGVLFDASAPSASNPDPSGQVGSYDGDISIDVSDADFSTAQGDSVTVTATNSTGSTIGQTTVSSAQTVTFSHTAEAGTNDITWTLTDSYGESDTLQQSFTTPSTLTIYNESKPSEKLTNVDVELRFYPQSNDPTIVNRTTSNGEIDMSGLPAGEPFVVVANAENYTSRRIYVPSLYEQQRVYLLPESVTTSSIEFELEDYTGNYPQENTVLLVQRALNGSWQTLQGDIFGATGEFTAQIKQDTRHRLVLENIDTGDRRVVGPYTPLGDASETIVVRTNGTIELEGLGPAISISPSARRLSATSGTSLTVDVDSQDNDLKYWNISITYQNESATQTLATINKTDPSGGTVNPTVNLANLSGGNVTVAVSWQTENGATGLKSAIFSVAEYFDNQYGLLNILTGALVARIPKPNLNAFTTFLGVAVTIFLTGTVAAQFRLSSEETGVVAVAVLSGFSVIGFVDYAIVFVGAVGLVALAGLRRGL